MIPINVNPNESIQQLYNEIPGRFLLVIKKGSFKLIAISKETTFNELNDSLEENDTAILLKGFGFTKIIKDDQQILDFLTPKKD